MKTTLLYLLFCLSTSVFHPFADWFLYKNQQMSIEFPQEPNITTQSVPTAVGDIEMKIASFESKNEADSNLAYVFIASDYPDSLINSGKKELLPQFFRASVDGAEKNVNGKLISEKEISIEGFPGREVNVDYGNGQAIISFRMYLVHNRAYFIQTLSETEKAANKDAIRFMNSFKLQR
ncbi:hypothetical protein [Paracnuella aquatica]|uniref:hypothetical protein n=1 Tax=Paracnuella aquatica TaxID=2268757 RepID=UPI000F5083D9|nr:hypothetical protein [Paracnuella aquatica]RPD50991.1 hypothetical protein DRJ53_05745 [Paracnuella aquatica]